MGIINKFIGIAEVASEHGEIVDLMLEVVHWFMLVLGLFWTCFFFYALFRFNRHKNKKADYHGFKGHVTMHLEIGIVVVEVILLVGFAYPLWSQQVDDIPTGPDVVKVRAVGEQFQWNFHYPGPDGQFGLIDKFLQTGDNPVGIDPDDPNGRDDFVSRNELVLPLGRHVVIVVTSKDVIHNLALTPMRIAHDAVPGSNTTMFFKPTKLSPQGDGTPGNPEYWDIICGQLCGPGHALMKGELHVRMPEDYDKWFKENTPAPAAPAPVPVPVPVPDAPAQ
jgi:cytochrome c oxidase subunit 2